MNRKYIAWLLIGVAFTAVIIFVAMWLLRPMLPQPSKQPEAPSQNAQQDTSNPQISIDNIADQQELRGTVTVEVSVTDDTGVEKVEYYVDNVLAGVSYAQPFSFRLNTTKLSNDKHTLKAVVFDAYGNKSETSVTIVIANKKASARAEGLSPAASSGSSSSVVGTSNNGAASTQPAKSSGNQHGNGNGNGGSGGGNGGGSTPDTSAPTAPANLQVSATDGYTTLLDWDASTDNTGVSEYVVYRDSTQLATTSSTSYTDQTVAPGNTYDYEIIAKDAADNTSLESNNPSITLEASTIWHDAESPAPGNFDNAPGAIELGVKFRPLVDGKVTGVRFYKAAGSTGTHVGHLWQSDGTPLASVNFDNETASGWQEATFSTPVEVTAGTTYVVSYFAPNGGYGYASAYFSSAGITSQYMTAMKSGVDGNNGVFRNGSAGFPTSSFNNTNYWVDALFAPNKGSAGPTPKALDNSGVYAGYPGSNNTGVVVGKRLPKRDRTLIVYNDNAVLDNLEISSDISIRGDNVTVRNLRVAPDQALIWGITQITGTSGLTVEDTEIYGDGTNQLQYGIQDNGTDFTARRVHIHTMTQAIQSNINVLIEDSYFHGQIYFAGDHSGGYLSTGGDNITLTHNNMRNPLNQTTTLGLFCDFGPVTNVTATNNLFAGGGYAVYAPPCAGSGGIKFINNKFSRALWPNGGFHGPVTLYNPAQTGNEWTGNTWLEDGTTVNP